MERARLGLLVAAVAASGLVATTTSSHAQRHQDRFGPMVPLDVAGVMTVRRGPVTVRAIAGTTPFLVIEKIRGNEVFDRFEVSSLSFGRRDVALSSRTWVQLVRFVDGELVFEVDGRRGGTQCRVDLGSAGRRVAASCGRHRGGRGGGHGGGHGGGEPRGPNWAGQPHVIQACGAAFNGSANESACLDVVARSNFDPAKAIAACERAMDGDANELACVRIAVASPVDPSAMLAPCERAMDGDGNELECFRVTSVSPRLGGSIDACEHAMDGDGNELACIKLAARAGRDLTSTIQACERAMNGDDSELACVERALR